jgi:hypothetical protein
MPINEGRWLEAEFPTLGVISSCMPILSRPDAPGSCQVDSQLGTLLPGVFCDSIHDTLREPIVVPQS